MLKKSEKIIYIKFENLILKKIFSELISILNEEISDVKFLLLDSISFNLESSQYFIFDEESIHQLNDNDIQQKIKKIYLISSKSVEIKTETEIVSYNVPLKFISFVNYIVNDIRQNFNKQNKIISFKFFNYDEAARRIFSDVISLTLTEKENEIFSFLISSKKSVSKKILLKNIWQYDESVDTHTLETHIYSLRKKLEKKLNTKNILEHKENGYFIHKELL